MIHIKDVGDLFNKIKSEQEECKGCVCAGSKAPNWVIVSLSKYIEFVYLIYVRYMGTTCMQVIQ